MGKLSLKGLGIALITPFNPDKSIDFETLGTLLDRQIEAGVNYLVVLGTTGESVTLTPAERAQVSAFVRERAGGRLPLVLGIGGNCTRAVIDDIERTDLTGYSAILSVCPFYNKPSQEGLYQHFMAIANASPVPVVLYNVPGRTGVNMNADTTLRLARDNANIIAVKEASGSISQVEAIIKEKPADFQVLSGDDALAFPMICIGAAGIISVIGNAYPRKFGRLVRDTLEGDLTSASALQHQLDPLYTLLFKDGNPVGVKSLMAHMGLIHNELRLPLVPATPATDSQLKQALETLGYD